MDFSLTDEQELFRDSIREFVTDRVPPERLAEIADGDGYDAGLWKEAASLGLAGVTVPEEQGGAGMGFLEEVIAAEELGRGVFPGPFLGSVILALPALEGAPDLLQAVSEGTTVATLAWADARGHFDPEAPAPEAEGSGEEWKVEGEAHFVPDLEPADLVVVAARSGDGVALLACEADTVEKEVLPTVDGTRRLGRVRFEKSPGRLLVEPDGGAETLRVIRTRARAALAAEGVGVASRVVELAGDYTKEREQFGRPVGTFQAVSHMIADAFMDAENARSLSLWAAAAIDAGEAEAPQAAAGAKAFAAESAVRACERAIQAHGGIGFTWEHVLHRYYKRALWIASYLGTPSELRAEVAAALLA